ncbi:Chymotrypsin-C [Smittium culicis]|uniref:Chymotrypsin-C n=1 Tax=Smittium culicis TaxID=133412 RepID=A0A1R1Y1U8_9FUNG|nr:Chymotrypsin-C [Smittium culicis]
MKVIAYSLLIASTLSASVPIIGSRIPARASRNPAQTSRVKRVINGSNADLTDFPYISNQDTLRNNSWTSCGGSLISSKHILTSAQCVHFGLETPAPSKDFILSYGNTNLEAFAEDTFNIDSYIVHPGFKYDEYKTNDIAIIVLKEPVDSSVASFAKIYDLPVTEGMISSAPGWGDRLGPNPRLLKKTDQKVSSGERCVRYNEKWNGNTGDTICIQENGISSTCFGDAGGPLALIDLPGSPIIGINSFFQYFGPLQFFGCNSINTTSYYTNVIKHIDFISESISVPKELLLYSTEGTNQEKDISIEKITGRKRISKRSTKND